MTTRFNKDSSTETNITFSNGLSNLQSSPEETTLLHFIVLHLCEFQTCKSYIFIPCVIFSLSYQISVALWRFCMNTDSLDKNVNDLNGKYAALYVMAIFYY